MWLGHLAKDCFHRPGDKAYELIEDDLSTADTFASSAADASDTDVVHKKKVVHWLFVCLLIDLLVDLFID